MKGMRRWSTAIKQLSVAVALASACHEGGAQSVQTPETEELRRRSQAEAQERQRQLSLPNVVVQTLPPLGIVHDLSLPVESPCFTIDQFILDVPASLPLATRVAGASNLPLDPFRFAQNALRHYAGACIGTEGVNLIVRRLQSQFLARGYSTTRLGIPPQDLSTGVLTLTLIPGVIRAIRFTDPTLYGSWHTAFPTGPGQLLTVTDLEQGLEQLQRVPSQQATMQIVPGEAPGDSDIVVDLQRKKPWRLTATVDDSGAAPTGKWQAGLGLAVDNLLGLNDVLNLGLTTDAERQGSQRGTVGDSLSYTLPYGNWNATLSGNSTHFHQSVAGVNQTFLFGGTTRNVALMLSYLFERDAAQKNRLQFTLGKRWSHATIADTEIISQRRDTTSAELAWVHTHYWGNAQLDVTLANRWGVNWANGQAYLTGANGAPDPTSNNLHSSVQTLDATLSIPFTIARQPVTYTGTVRGQTTHSPLYLSDQFSIGNRYTVRGFDGELTLAAERGVYWRNELAFPLANSGQAAYVGLDVGKVFGPSVVDLAGNTLAGTALGVRGNLKGLTYDVFSSWALVKPRGFSTAMPAVGVSLAVQY
ncbi:ShlB/FhaC/HecB family hemolysin secretion/activation protein [Glaciimonas sp. PAMC28666]|uniref:ShlB/FhaC/HecB family hemolysin secretion/activation protein n=1 Tax=Glaciimonas sp. PAMC28666 TaxID=2807626 RepID=UPI001964E5D7|nr:ShlB/FhaC/HecB family hemolysin secretion/activation protein [Glaciimonas sp. PAMC28666]QRX80832.1 ShlB/FhaC/HecB family hemolysin secretion/activation protein [Glaciimonas sp. PAMC28666]